MGHVPLSPLAHKIMQVRTLKKKQKKEWNTKGRKRKGETTRGQQQEKGEVGEEYEGKDRENLGDGSIEEE